MTNQLHICAQCGIQVPESELYTFDGQALCLHCLEENTVLFRECGIRIWREDNAGTEDISLCQRCYDEHYTSCCDCGTLLHIANANYLSAALAGSDIQGSEPRVCTNYNCLRWAFQMFLRSLVSKGMHPARSNQLSLRMERAINLALRQYQLQKDKLGMTIRRGNLAYCILEGYRNKAFHLTKNVEKLNSHDGIVWKNDLCLRPKILLAYIRKQPGYQDYTQNRLSMELTDLSALVLQEENSYTVHIAKSEHSQIPRVYRIKLNVLKKTAQKE